jgi:hypothetical protein
MNVYEKIREVFGNARKYARGKEFIVTKTWFVRASNTTEAVELTEQKPHNWLQVIPYLGDNNDNKT